MLRKGSSSCSTSGTRDVNLVTNPVISRERGKDRDVFTTSGTYTWSLMTHIFHSGHRSQGGDSPIKEILIGTTSSGISCHLRDMYSICRLLFFLFCKAKLYFAFYPSMVRILIA